MGVLLWIGLVLIVVAVAGFISRRLKLEPAVVVGVVGVTLAALQIVQNAAQPAPPTSAPPTSAPPTSAPPTSAPPTSETPTSTPPPPQPSSPTEVAYYLADFDAVQAYGINVDSAPRKVNS